MLNLTLHNDLASQVLLTGLISFSTTFIIIGFVAMKLNKDSWDLQCCLLFSMTIGITDPIHSVKSLKTIGTSDIFLSLAFQTGE